MSLIIYDVSNESNLSITDETYNIGDVLLFTGSSNTTQIRIDLSTVCTILLYNLTIDLSKSGARYPLFIQNSKDCTLSFFGKNTLLSGQNKCAIRLGSTIPSLHISSPSLEHSLTLNAIEGVGGICKYITKIDESIAPMQLELDGGSIKIITSHAPGIGIYYQTEEVAQNHPSAALNVSMYSGTMNIYTEDVPCIGYKNGELTQSTLSLHLYNGTIYAHSTIGPAISSTTKSLCNITVEKGTLYTSTDAVNSQTSDVQIEEGSNSTIELSGAIFIEEHAPKCGDTLHGILSDLNPIDATYDTLWIRVPTNLSMNEEVIVGHSDEYMLTADDVGYLILYRLVGKEKYRGTLETHVGPIPKMDGLAAPIRPILLSKTQTSLTIEKVEGIEYAIRQANGDSLGRQLYTRQPAIDTTYRPWQTSGVFTDLLPDSQYQIIARYQYNPASQEASQISRPLYASTLRVPFSARASRNKIYGLGEIYFPGEEITLRAQGTGVNIASPIEGDTRYIPVSYSLHGKDFFWKEEPYIATFQLTTMGQHTVTVNYRKEQYQNGSWCDTLERSEQSATFTISYGDVPPPNATLP